MPLSPTGTASALGRPFIGPSGYVYGLSFSPDSTHLASTSDDNSSWWPPAPPLSYAVTGT